MEFTLEEIDQLRSMMESILENGGSELSDAELELVAGGGHGGGQHGTINNILSCLGLSIGGSGR